nr:MAG: hypothetical protein [Grapevine umbra-like virus 2]
MFRRAAHKEEATVVEEYTHYEGCTCGHRPMVGHTKESRGPPRGPPTPVSTGGKGKKKFVQEVTTTNVRTIEEEEEGHESEVADESEPDEESLDESSGRSDIKVEALSIGGQKLGFKGAVAWGIWSNDESLIDDLQNIMYDWVDEDQDYRDPLSQICRPTPTDGANYEKEHYHRMTKPEVVIRVTDEATKSFANLRVTVGFKIKGVKVAGAKTSKLGAAGEPVTKTGLEEQVVARLKSILG